MGSVMNLKALTTGATIAMATIMCQPAYSALIFDNADAPLNTTFRGPGNEPVGVAAYLQIGASDVTISQIAINAEPGQDGLLEFVIFDDTAPPGSNAGPLELSDTVSVAASGSLSYILSDPISFTLLAGHYYDIGAVFNGTSINYSFDQIADTQNGITSIVLNENVDDFGAPVLTGHAGADINIQLFGGTAPVPEPVSIALFGAGLAGLGIARRRKSS